MERRLIRVLPRERQDTAEAADVLGIPPPLDLDDFAEARALPGAVDLGDFDSPRDLVREALEELADGRNYLVWRLRELRGAGAPVWQIQRTKWALGCLVLAWRATVRLSRD